MKINYEYRKGILFIRLKGILEKNSVINIDKEINYIIDNTEVYNLVLNLENVTDIDQKGIHLIYYLYEKIKNKKGKIYICNNLNEDMYKKLKKKRIFNYINKIDNELESFNLIKV